MKHDAIVIGSGLGSLTAAALLTRYAGKRVLVLEQYSKIGGCTHSFRRRKDSHFDVGVHYVNSVSPDDYLGQLLTELTEGRLKWKPLPNELDHACFPDQDYVVPSNWRDLIVRLRSEFPEEESSLNQFLETARQTSQAFIDWQLLELLPSLAAGAMRCVQRVRHPLMFQSTKQVLDRFFKDDRMKAVLAAQWPGMGVGIETLSFGYFASNLHSLNTGAWYPVGGGERIAEELAAIVRAGGGEVRTQSPVSEILIEGRRAVGVKVSDETIHAEQIVSGVGARITYLKLIKKVEAPWRAELESSVPRLNYLMAFMSLNRSPRELGIDGASYWIFNDDQYGSFYPGDPELEFLNFLWVGSPSIKRGSGGHTLEFGAMVPAEAFEKWKGSEWRRRPSDYEAFKESLFKAMISVSEQRFPGLSEAVEHWEVSTPLSVEHFVSASGMGLGLEMSSKRYWQPFARCVTPFESLYLTGSDTFAWGVSSAIGSGVKVYRLMQSGRSIASYRQGIRV